MEMSQSQRHLKWTGGGLEQSNSHRQLLNSSKGVSGDNSIKIVLLGESGAGKSSLALRFVKNDFRPYSETTIGASFFSKTMMYGHTEVEFKIWDTAGQEKYHSLAPMYYRGAGAAILVFDICRGVSFQTLQIWVNELRNCGPPGIVLCICGNKLDLNADRTVKQEDALYYAEKVGAFYMETSARDNINVQELFLEIAKRVNKDEWIDNNNTSQQTSSSSLSTNINLSSSSHLAPSTSSCC